MKATEQYFPVALFIMLHKIVLIFKFIQSDFGRYYLRESEACKNIMEHVQLLIDQQKTEREGNANQRQKTGGGAQTSTEK